MCDRVRTRSMGNTFVNALWDIDIHHPVYDSLTCFEQSTVSVSRKVLLEASGIKTSPIFSVDGTYKLCQNPVP